MIPLIPTLALAFFSLLCSSFVILRIIIPILPPHPLSRRVPPSEFGLPNFRSLSAADKSHVWLSLCDVLALSIFVWEAVSESMGGAWGYQSAADPGSSARLWFALTVRQSCLLVVSAITLLHVRMGRSVSFGKKHWVLWAPMFVLVIASTALAGIMSGAGMSSFFVGYVAYSTTLAVLSTVSFTCLTVTLVIIKRNLCALNEAADPWPPAKEVEERPRPSFATEDVDAMREGSSWITSHASSQHESISAFSFSTHHDHAHHHAAAMASNPSIPAKSSFWFNPSTHDMHAHDSVPPVPPLPSPYKNQAQVHSSLREDPDPFRRSESPHAARARMGSQSSWLTSSDGSHRTLSAWSYPTTVRDPPMMAAMASTQDLNVELLPSVSRPVTPAMSSAQVLGGYGYSPSTSEAEKGIAALAAAPSGDIDVSLTRIIGWMAGIWVPYALALPYFFSASSASGSSFVMPLLLVISVTISSPILALNIVLRSPIPIPTNLFDVHSGPPSIVARALSPQNTLPVHSSEYKRSGSMTVIEGRRSTDVWVAKGDAVDGKSRVGRALGMLAPAPKLSVLPPENNDARPSTPPLPIQDDLSPPPTAPTTPYSEISAELGRTRKQSRTSSHFSSADESLAFSTRIMVAQRHYSAVATTMVIPPSPEKRASTGGLLTPGNLLGVSSALPWQPTHVRSRSASSLNRPNSPMSPPPSAPLPPTPPTIKSSHYITHKKSYSSGFDFGAVGNDEMNEIDALSAGLLPLLVPGLKVGNDVRVSGDWAVRSPPGTFSKGSKADTDKKARRAIADSFGADSEFGGFATSAEFESPDVHSTPVHRRGPRPRTPSAHKKNHFSLPGLALGKDGARELSAWTNATDDALEARIEEYKASTVAANDQRKSVWGSESIANEENYLVLKPESDVYLRHALSGSTLARSPSGRTLGPRPSSLKLEDLPTSVNTARSSLATLIAALDQPSKAPASANSEVTLFDFTLGTPVAESTPVEHRRNSAASQRTSPTHRRSSIVYIKSANDAASAPAGLVAPAPNDENAPPSAKPLTPPSTSGRLAQWSTRAVRPLVPKQSKKAAPADASGSPKTASPGGGGLRPLALLQNRDSSAEGARAAGNGKQKQKQREDAAPSGARARTGTGIGLRHKKLRSLKLARSDTTREREVLRGQEVLPDVVVRPPSQTQHTEYAYTFR